MRAPSGRSGLPVGQRLPKEPPNALHTRSTGSAADGHLQTSTVRSSGPSARRMRRTRGRVRAPFFGGVEPSSPIHHFPNRQPLEMRASSNEQLTSSSRSLPLPFFFPPRPRKLDTRLFLTVFWDPEVSIELKLMTRSPMPMWGWAEDAMEEMDGRPAAGVTGCGLCWADFRLNMSEGRKGDAADVQGLD